ncbi:hypothetical protein QTI24_24870 [Variovorax sp. J22P240]|uniref:hypothetical protein n=1 Tax=unclassified Variovorax TaxID=663243 RepID=UPI002575A9A1|nr:MULTISPECIES: hypothetical protein [unclassified Variovorax]MDM0001865.1 hypothetical protein [Variovorax sp. J22P240]MDM0047727.1 hypothetical protein [Variovorax sp. J22R115]
MTLTVASLLVAGCASAPSTAPLPADLAIVAPDPSVPADVRALSGKWSGKWRGLAGGQQQETVLIVEKIAGNEATVVYSQGDHSRFRSLYHRATANVEPGFLTFTFALKDGPAVYTYRLQPDGSLDAKMEYRGFNAVSTLKRAT